LRDAAAARGCELRDYQLGAAAVPWGRIALGALLLFQTALVFVLIVRWRSRAPLQGLASAGGRVMALAVVAGIALAGAALGAATVILPEARTPHLLELLLQQPYGRLAMSVVAIGVAPVVEELFFRRLMLQRFVAAGWLIVGVLLTSAAFANLHLWQASDLATAVYAWTATLLGSLLLSAVYLRTRSWRVSAVMHAAYNGTLVLPLWV
jgi:membrane protease YdiL (CAAX protease family)